MMYRIQVSPQDVAASRFAISPMVETSAALRTVNGFHPAGALRPWAERMREPYRRILGASAGLRALVALFRHNGYNADFVSPPPISVVARFEDELERVRSTPPDQARSEIERNLEGHAVPGEARAILTSPDVVEIIADALELAWRHLVEPEWPRFSAILERDVVQRGGRLTSYGWAAALDDLDPHLRWDPAGLIELRDGISQLNEHALDGRGLLFVPSVFIPKVICYLEEAWPYAMVYPARGVGAPDGRAAGALEGLIGRSRARILVELAVPATTSQLAAHLALSLGATGEHVTALRRSGLIIGSRTGRSVLYQRTPLGDALVTP
ncbi:winged helix-turn-helix transcriptional regulator [Streptosporangiaceae bacterium NEAU-GS5]|nr:winged helix-turn-helix transcriptional regulator [Streptosporangiaceae bacterium NEAU-GS5]